MEQISFVVNIGIAFLMGSAIGIERQVRQHPAGLRTNALVCVGAALFVSLSRLMDQDGSPTRIAAQVVRQSEKITLTSCRMGFSPSPKESRRAKAHPTREL